MRPLIIPILFSVLLLLQGCAALIGGAAATGIAVAYDRRTTGTIVEDQSIELKAGKAFRQDSEINNTSHLNVTSYNLIVLVTGETPSEELRERIINIVKNIPKVRQVYNEITIAAPSSLTSRSSDTLITSKVKTRLFGADNVEGTSIKVVTEKGIVYLMGLVSRAEAEQATEAARNVGGAQKIVKLFQYTD